MTPPSGVGCRCPLGGVRLAWMVTLLRQPGMARLPQ